MNLLLCCMKESHWSLMTLSVYLTVIGIHGLNKSFFKEKVKTKSTEAVINKYSCNTGDVTIHYTSIFIIV